MLLGMRCVKCDGRPNKSTTVITALLEFLDVPEESFVNDVIAKMIFLLFEWL